MTRDIRRLCSWRVQALVIARGKRLEQTIQSRLCRRYVRRGGSSLEEEMVGVVAEAADFGR